MLENHFHDAGVGDVLVHAVRQKQEGVACFELQRAVVDVQPGANAERTTEQAPFL
jgi:hypothetical protein